MEEIVKGPRTSNTAFLTKHINRSIPEMKKAADLALSGDIVAAEKTFADYIRAFLNPKKLNRSWIETAKIGDVQQAIDRLKPRVDDIMDYKFVSCRIPFHFKDHKIDWESNPTYNQYKEWPWQLSRHPEFTVLAEYYTYTKDENVAKTWVDMIESWFEQAIVPENAPSYATLCWRTIEAGIRMTGWSRQIHSFISSPNLSDEFITRYYASIYEHGWRLRGNPTHGNWFLMELHGLLRISLLYPFLADAKEWEAFALRSLEAEFDIQVYPDGFQYELSTGYHGVVYSNYYGIINIYKELELPIPEFLNKKFAKVFEMYSHLVRPDGRLPNINDADTPIIIDKMQVANRLYPERKDFEWFATKGERGEKPDYLSYAFPYAGSVAMRTSWDADAVWGYMDCSPFGRGHQHEDKLNVLVSAYGKNMLIEAGIYDYDSSEMRKYVLDTRGHNTIRINSQNQNQRKTYKWADEDINKKADLEFRTTPDVDYACAKFDAGYGDALDPVIHERKLYFFKNIKGTTPFFVAVDRLTAPDDEVRTYESQWHYENCDFKTDVLYASGDFGDGVGLTTVFSDTNAQLVDMMGQYEPYYQGWFPIRPSGPHEHRKIPTPVLCGKFKTSYRIVTVIYPYKDGENIVKAVRASSDIGAKDFTIILDDGKEITLGEV